MERFYCIPQVLDFGLTKTGGGAAIKGLWNCLNQEGVDRAETFALQIASRNGFGTSLKLHYIWAQATTVTTSQAKFSEQKGHTVLTAFGFFFQFGSFTVVKLQQPFQSVYTIPSGSPRKASPSVSGLELLRIAPRLCSCHPCTSLCLCSLGASPADCIAPRKGHFPAPLLHGFHSALSVAVRTVHRSVWGPPALLFGTMLSP